MNNSKDFKHLYQKYKKKYYLLKQKQFGGMDSNTKTEYMSDFRRMKGGMTNKLNDAWEHIKNEVNEKYKILEDEQQKYKLKLLEEYFNEAGRMENFDSLYTSEAKKYINRLSTLPGAQEIPVPLEYFKSKDGTLQLIDNDNFKAGLFNEKVESGGKLESTYKSGFYEYQRVIIELFSTQEYDYPVEKILKEIDNHMNKCNDEYCKVNLNEAWNLFRKKANYLKGGTVFPVRTVQTPWEAGLSNATEPAKEEAKLAEKYKLKLLEAYFNADITGRMKEFDSLYTSEAIKYKSSLPSLGLKKELTPLPHIYLKSRTIKNRNGYLILQLIDNENFKAILEKKRVLSGSELESKYKSEFNEYQRVIIELFSTQEYDYPVDKVVEEYCKKYNCKK